MGIPAAGLVLLAVVALFAAPVLSLVGASPTPAPVVASTSPTATPTPPPTYGPIVFNPTGPTPGPTPLPPYLLSGYVWPLDKPFITLPFGPSSYGDFLVNGRPFHDGIDIATTCWDKVRAAHDGLVLTAGQDYVDFMGWRGDLSEYKELFSNTSWKASLPNVIVIDDGNGYRSIYAHMITLTVAAGQKVKAGQIIGYEGATGHATGCHLHYGLYSPQEPAVWETMPSTVEKLKLPEIITRRVDPLLVLPFRFDIPDLALLMPIDQGPAPSPTPR